MERYLVGTKNIWYADTKKYLVASKNIWYVPRDIWYDGSRKARKKSESGERAKKQNKTKF